MSACEKNLWSISENILIIILYAAAFALMVSITFRIPIHTVISVNTSTTLPRSVNGDS